ncbi:GL20475 [Drosophila persimilis]|uniref:GL20475 n=1 Tax=Drosophila persimilis TaxID=7234 RepID=B4H7Q3_DROPE|nr:GL20475 [Drosophila persimilis]
MFEVLDAQINIVDCGVRCAVCGLLSSVFAVGGQTHTAHTVSEDKRTSSSNQNRTMGKFVVKKQPQRSGHQRESPRKDLCSCNSVWFLGLGHSDHYDDRDGDDDEGGRGGRGGWCCFIVGMRMPDL